MQYIFAIHMHCLMFCLFKITTSTEKYLLDSQKSSELLTSCSELTTLPAALKSPAVLSALLSSALVDKRTPLPLLISIT